MSSLEGRSTIRSWVLSVTFGQVLDACYSNHIWKATKFIGTIDIVSVAHSGGQGTRGRQVGR